MKKYLALAVLLLSSPASATLLKYSWTGEVDGDSRAVSGSFLYEDSAPIISEELGGYTVRGGAINKLSLTIGTDNFTRFVSPWDALIAPDGKVTFQDCALDQTPASATDWNDERWAIRFWNPETSELREVAGKVVSFYSEGWGENPLPGRDSNPVPEPSGFVLMASGFAAAGLFRWSRRSRT